MKLSQNCNYPFTSRKCGLVLVNIHAALLNTSFLVYKVIVYRNACGVWFTRCTKLHEKQQPHLMDFFCIPQLLSSQGVRVFEQKKTPESI